MKEEEIGVSDFGIKSYPCHASASLMLANARCFHGRGEAFQSMLVEELDPGQAQAGLHWLLAPAPQKVMGSGMDVGAGKVQVGSPWYLNSSDFSFRGW